MGVNWINLCKDIILLELQRALCEISDLGERLRSSARAGHGVTGSEERGGYVLNCIGHNNIQVITSQRLLYKYSNGMPDLQERKRPHFCGKRKNGPPADGAFERDDAFGQCDCRNVSVLPRSESRKPFLDTCG